MSKPGIMIYFDMTELLRHLSSEERGDLFLAMMEYGQYGKEPELTGKNQFLWMCIKPRLDRDDMAYQETVLQRKYATFCRKRKKVGLSRISFDEWNAMTEEQRMKKLSPEIES